jgi:hypothetical protein
MSNQKFVKLAGKVLTWDELLEHLRAKLWAMSGAWGGIAGNAKVTYRWLRTFIHAEKCEVTVSRVMRLAAAIGVKVVITMEDSAPINPGARPHPPRFAKRRV